MKSSNVSLASVQDFLKKNSKVVAAAVGGTVIVVGSVYVYRRLRAYPKKGSYPPSSLPVDAYDALIVGGGPSGSTCAYFMATGGAKAAVLEKETFPRDKYCGDAVCTPAIRILEEMGVMKELKDNNEAHFADAGGFVSPSGISFIGASKKKLGQAAACAVKRIHLDMRIAKNAQRAGADLQENFEVVHASFDKATGLWTVTSADGKSVKGRVLVCADGATSKLATKLGYCTEAPKGICSRSFIEGGSHNANFDGVCFYPRESLPGYCALFRHPNDELGYCYYLIPCGGKEGQCGGVNEADLPRLHNDAIKNDPFISKALGPNPKVERMKVASLRLGGQGLKTTFDDHLIIVGDAAGHIDPLTGEGIHTAIMGGKCAAEAILSMRQTGDFSKKSTRMFSDKWNEKFGHDFFMSKAMAWAIWKVPLLMDAIASETQRKGDAMLAVWAEIMTNMRSKMYFFRPDVGLPLAVAIVREAVEQYVVGKEDKYKK